MKLNYPGEFSPVEFSLAARRQFLERLGKERYDLCIIGGGITGAGIARDAALRGLSVVLLEKADFASGTSSKSSKLVHGGMRYLKQYEFRLVREALIERYVLMKLAPHLVRRLPCIYPIYRNAADGYWKIKAGMMLYDTLCGIRGIGRHCMISSRRIEKMVPQLRPDGLCAGARYYDAGTDDTRLVMATVQSAVAAGCLAINYAQATGFEIANDRVGALLLKDRLSGVDHTVRAQVYVNAAGPWSDEVRCLIRDCGPSLRPTKGVHLVIPWQRLPLDYAIMLISRFDNRPFYTIPCREKNLTMLGTTDTDYKGDIDCLFATEGDASYLLDSFNHYFPKISLSERDVISSFAGLRPLMYEDGKSTGKVSREHRIFMSPKNLAHIIGGKLTTYRPMAKDLLQYVARKCGLGMSPCITDRRPLYGGEISDWPAYFAEKIGQITREFCISENVAGNLLHSYGRRVDDILELLRANPCLKEPIVEKLPYIWGQLPYAVRREAALTLEDFLLRRTHIFSLDWDQGRKVAPKVADEMGKLLGWEKEERERQIESYLREVELNRAFRIDRP